MTIICFRAGIMAADSLVTKGAVRYGTVKKIERLPDGSVFAACGSGADCEAAFRYIRDGGEKPKISGDDSFRAIMGRPGSENPFEMDEHLTPREMFVPFAVVGESKAEAVCIGAMEMGASAKRAVEIAIKHTVWVGGPVQVEAVPGLARAGKGYDVPTKIRINGEIIP